ncbi:MAG: hypothetical protein GXO37_06555 [Chloroflexi bacterium]|nr:hypothetical protein [Chloroflexota bacterium]
MRTTLALRRLSRWGWLVLFVVLLLGCGWWRRIPATPAPLPTPTALPSPEAVLKDAAQQLQTTGQVELRFHESQANAYVQKVLAKQPDAPVREVAVYFRDGRILAYATMDSPLGPLAVEVVVVPTVTEDGQIDLQVEKATLGGMSMPQSLLNDYLGQLDQALNTWVARYAVDSLEIADGWLVVRAHRR